MSVKKLLEEMLGLLKAQVDAVIRGDHQAVRTGAEQYERLLAELEKTQFDTPAAELRELYDAIDREKAKLQSLVSVEVSRVEFLLRLLVNSGTLKPIGYPGQSQKGEPPARMLNRRA